MNASFELDGYSKNGGGVQRSRSAGCGGSAHASPAVTRAQSSGSGEIEPGKIVVKRIPLGCTQAMLRESFGRSALDQTVLLCVFCRDDPFLVWHGLLLRLCALRHACRRAHTHTYITNAYNTQNYRNYIPTRACVYALILRYRHNHPPLNRRRCTN